VYSPQGYAKENLNLKIPLRNADRERCDKKKLRLRECHSLYNWPVIGLQKILPFWFWPCPFQPNWPYPDNMYLNGFQYYIWLYDLVCQTDLPDLQEQRVERNCFLKSHWPADHKIFEATTVLLKYMKRNDHLLMGGVQMKALDAVLFLQWV
jgi:hypothetical protein